MQTTQSKPGNLVLTRRVGEAIEIGDGIVITVLRINRDTSVRLSVSAPKTVSVRRTEVEQLLPLKTPDELAAEVLGNSLPVVGMSPSELRAAAGL